MTNTFYFENLKTVEEIKIRYRDLAKQYHPDLGGDAETMKTINGQYHDALKACNGQIADERAYNYKADIEQELMDKLSELLKLKQLEVILIGYWIWVTGDTKPFRIALKDADLIWHPKRKCWYYKPKSWRRSYSSQGSLYDLARKYGYRDFKNSEQDALPAA